MRVEDEWAESVQIKAARAVDLGKMRQYTNPISGPWRKRRQHRDTWALVALVAAAVLIACMLAACGGGSEPIESNKQDSGDPTKCAPGQVNCK